MGLGGLAVALGLQPTLSNLFAGMQITLGGTLNVGDFVKLESGEEGTIEDIHWRVTRVRTLVDTFVVVPNARLAESIVTNYHLPTKGIAILIPVGVHSASDLDQVERVTCDVARSVMQAVQGGVPEFDPFIRYKSFGDSSVDFNVILRIREFKDNLLVRHAFIKALVRAYAAEGIVIPFPVRALNLEQEGAFATNGGARLGFDRDTAMHAEQEEGP
jgi:small-conductance mechanosensitive channel